MQMDKDSIIKIAERELEKAQATWDRWYFGYWTGVIDALTDNVKQVEDFNTPASRNAEES